MQTLLGEDRVGRMSDIFLSNVWTYTCICRLVELFGECTKSVSMWVSSFLSGELSDDNSYFLLNSSSWRERIGFACERVFGIVS